MPAIHVDLLLEQPAVAHDAPQVQHAVLRLTAVKREAAGRAPVDLVACVDVSGSMQGRKLEAAREAVAKLVRELDARDRLGLVTFSTHADTVAPVRTMDADGRAHHAARAQALEVQGNTNLSEGLHRSLEELKRSPRPAGSPDALGRVLLFTDGHANAGLHENEREAWAQLLQEQLGARSVSWLGFGEDHDARFLSWLADRTKGNAYVARDADAISAAFAQELGGLLGTAAQHVRVRLRSPFGALRLVNDERHQFDADTLEMQVDSLTSEEVKDLVVELPRFAGPRGAVRRVLEADVSWVDTTSGKAESLTRSAEVSFVDARDVQPPELTVREALVLQRAAAGLRDATRMADRDDYTGAAELLFHLARQALAVPTERAQRLAQLLETLAREYGDRNVYRSSTSKHASISRSLSKQRSSGSDADGLYETTAQRVMRAKFEARAAAPVQPPPAAPESDSGKARAPDAKPPEGEK